MKYLLCVCALRVQPPTPHTNRAANQANVGKYKPSPPIVAPAAKVAAVSAPAPVQSAPAVVNIPAPIVPVPIVPKTANSDAEAEVINNESHFYEDGSYHAVAETNNGIYSESSGTLKKVGDVNTLIVTGNFKYYGQDGTPIYFTYTADENGYHPQSDLLPVGPPVPQEILDSIAYNAKYAPVTEENKP